MGLLQGDKSPTMEDTTLGYNITLNSNTMAQLTCSVVH